MPAPRFLARIAGRTRQVIATLTSAGVADAEKIVATNAAGILDPTLVNAKATSAGAADSGKIPQLDATGRLDTTFMPVGLGADIKSVISSENLSAGNFVNVYNNAGVLNVRRADATSEGKEAVGFVLAATTAPAQAVVYFEGTNTQLSGMTVGARQYLSTTPGARTEVEPTASGNVGQYLGVALSATELSFEIDDAVTIA